MNLENGEEGGAWVVRFLEGVRGCGSLVLFAGDSKEQPVPIKDSDSDRWSLKFFFKVDSNELVRDRK